MRAKKYDVDKEISRCGIYRPLCFEENGKIIKANYDREGYCEILRTEAYDMYEAKNRAEFLASYAQAVLGFLDDENYDCDEPEKELERLRKKMDRFHNRILSGKIPNDGTVSSDKVCYHLLEQIQRKYKKSLLMIIVDSKPFYNENKYIYSLVVQLIEIMYASEMFMYVPNSNNFQLSCYRRHLKMIEDNIKDIFQKEEGIYSKWNDILTPLRELICNCNYPGISKGDIWYKNCEELRFFDYTYEIAKNYELYCTVKERLVFDLGDTKEEVDAELFRKNKFFNKEKQTESALFCNTMLETFKKIAREEFLIDV